MPESSFVPRGDNWSSSGQQRLHFSPYSCIAGLMEASRTTLTKDSCCHKTAKVRASRHVDGVTAMSLAQCPQLGAVDWAGVEKTLQDPVGTRHQAPGTPGSRQQAAARPRSGSGEQTTTARPRDPPSDQDRFCGTAVMLYLLGCCDGVFIWVHLVCLLRPALTRNGWSSGTLVLLSGWLTPPRSYPPPPPSFSLPRPSFTRLCFLDKPLRIPKCFPFRARFFLIPRVKAKKRISTPQQSLGLGLTPRFINCQEFCGALFPDLTPDDP
ncbi:hypothetical protein RRG08_031338 [Elysia crispata]|uniref:Uncharacterized protein n=1 Tax=Elysia crispata TaxID=231223 RepID=A0AAE0YJ42_9GAST|nr:hypothetical protein RRG08_031338 [Elysia crispata]